MNNKELQKILSKFDFFTYKNLRKETLDSIKEENSKNIGSSLEVEYKGFKFFIVWANDKGITSYVFKNDMLLSEIWYISFIPKEKLVKKTKNYIKYLYKKGL